MSIRAEDVADNLDIVTEGSPMRFVTAASLFDGHDAAINVMRRMIQAEGVEVIHLGHNRSVADVVRAAIQEDADGIAMSSYQGGHNEYFKYMVDMLREAGAGHIRVFGGGGGTITPEEIAELEAYGVERIYHPNDGMKMGLDGMIRDLIERASKARQSSQLPDSLSIDDFYSVARTLSALEDCVIGEQKLETLRKEWKMASGTTPVIGITGTGGAGKSSVTDEIMSRFCQYFSDKKIAVLAVDPTRRRTGGALLGDRIRMNSLRHKNLFMRSMATRRQHLSTSEMLADAITFLKSVGFDMIIVETAGIGQSDSQIVDLVDISAYIMTSEYGAASQLEKIDMLDFADVIVLNKYDKRGAEDALRDIRKQWKRNHVKFDATDEEIPVYPTIASQFNDPGISWMFSELCQKLCTLVGDDRWLVGADKANKEPRATVLIPGKRVRYLAEIAEQGRSINSTIETMCENAARAQYCHAALREIGDDLLPLELEPYSHSALTEGSDKSLLTLRQRYNASLEDMGTEARQLLLAWPERLSGITAEEYNYDVRGKVVTGSNYKLSLSQQKIPKIAPPRFDGWSDLLRFLMKENLPGAYPYTGGTFPYRREGEDPIRMFAGEGTPERTNRRFHYLSEGQPAARLSTAFDSVTLYGEDPHERPDIYGKVGNSGVSIATVDDAKKLYSGFDLCSPTTSVSMTINGPAPIILAFFMNAAIDQQVEKHLKETGQWPAAEEKIAEIFKGKQRPSYVGAIATSKQWFRTWFIGSFRRSIGSTRKLIKK